MLKIIVNIEVEITRIEDKLKLGQSKETRDIVGAGETLRASDEHVVGDTMLTCAAAKTE